MDEQTVMYCYRVYVGPEMRVVFRLNGIPFQRGIPQVGIAENLTGFANHFLVPGRNTLTVDVLEGPENGMAFCDLSIGWYDRIVRIDYPAPPDAMPVAQPHPVPWTQSVDFDAAAVRNAPPWATAEKGPLFGPDGDDELHVAVQSFHHAVAMHDANAVVDQLALKTAHMERTFRHPATTDAAARRHLAEVLPKMKSPPYRREEMAFERCADGRVAYVTRKNGGKAIDATAEDGSRFATDLWLTRDGGAWKIYT